MNQEAFASPARAHSSAYLGLVYSGLAYVLFLGSFTAFALAVTGLWAPWAGKAELPAALAALVNAGLVASFALQHTVMARASFKARWTRLVPPHLERSTFVLFASVLLAGIVLFWQPLPGALWSVDSPFARTLLRVGFIAGYLGVVACSFLIDHFHLFGLQQSWRYSRGLPALEPSFHEPWAYRRIRHPMMTSVIVMLWSTPEMSAAQALLAGLFTLYVLAGTVFEERELAEQLGEDYAEYRTRVRWKLVPGVF